MPFFFSGDSAELWVTLNAMGYNHALTQDEVALFEVSACHILPNNLICNLPQEFSNIVKGSLKASLLPHQVDH